MPDNTTKLSNYDLAVLVRDTAIRIINPPPQTSPKGEIEQLFGGLVSIVDIEEAGKLGLTGLDMQHAREVEEMQEAALRFKAVGIRANMHDPEPEIPMIDRESHERACLELLAGRLVAIVDRKDWVQGLGWPSAVEHFFTRVHVKKTT